MKLIITFVVGLLCGASGLAYLLGVTPSALLYPPLAAASATAAPQMTAAVVLASPAVLVAPAGGSNAALALVAPVAVAAAPAPSLLPAPAPVPQVLPADSAPAKPIVGLMIPVDGVKASELADTFEQSRGSERRHEALDILAPRGTRVFAVADGKVVKLFNSVAGGITLYQFDATEKYAYYYAHLDSYAPAVVEGTWLKRGDLLGYVGSTGNASPAAPHLHFAIFELTPEKKWWQGRPINPYPLLRQ